LLAFFEELFVADFWFWTVWKKYSASVHWISKLPVWTKKK